MSEIIQKPALKIKIVTQEQYDEITKNDGFEKGTLVFIENGFQNDGLPVASIVPSLSTSVPMGYLYCNGAKFKKEEYPDLYSNLGPAFSVDSVFFHVPDLRGLFLRGESDGSEIDPKRKLGTFQNWTVPDIKGYLYSYNGDWETAAICDGNLFKKTVSPSGELSWKPQLDAWTADGTNAVEFNLKNYFESKNVSNEISPSNFSVRYYIKAFGHVKTNEGTFNSANVSARLNSLETSTQNIDITIGSSPITLSGTIWDNLENVSSDLKEVGAEIEEIKNNLSTSKIPKKVPVWLSDIDKLRVGRTIFNSENELKNYGKNRFIFNKVSKKYEIFISQAGPNYQPPFYGWSIINSANLGDAFIFEFQKDDSTVQSTPFIISEISHLAQDYIERIEENKRTLRKAIIAASPLGATVILNFTNVITYDNITTTHPTEISNFKFLTVYGPQSTYEFSPADLELEDSLGIFDYPVISVFKLEN